MERGGEEWLVMAQTDKVGRIIENPFSKIKIGDPMMIMLVALRQAPASPPDFAWPL